MTEATLRNALENCRLYAARYRKEVWAQTVLRFCNEAGVTGSPLRQIRIRQCVACGYLFVNEPGEDCNCPPW